MTLQLWGVSGVDRRLSTGNWWTALRDGVGTTTCQQEGTKQTLFEGAQVIQCVQQDITHLLLVCCGKYSFLCSLYLLGLQHQSQPQL